MLKTVISKALCIKKIILWGVIGCGCVLALGVFFQRFLEDLDSGKDIFYPGVLLLALVVFSVFCLSAKIVVKHVRILWESE